MIFLKKSLILLVFVLSSASAQIKDVNNIKNNNVDVLLEKITQTKKKEEKNKLIENLKEKLAKKNIQAQEESDAILKAKQKIPLKLYRPSFE